MMLLHGEQYLAIKRWPLPTQATVVNKPKLLEVLDKGMKYHAELRKQARF